MACGEVGLVVTYFYSLTPRQFDNILKGYIKKQEEQTKTSWEQTRYVMWIMASVNSTKKIELTKLLQFPWDDASAETPKPSKAELKAMFKKWDQLEFKKQ